MSTTATATTPYCFRCQHHPSPDDAPLKRCGRCRSRHYCSQQCQSNDWPRHKEECRILAAGGTVSPRMRTTMRFTMGGLGHPGGIDPDVIYYLKTSRPHLKDTSISGPCYPLDTVYEQMFRHLARERSVGGEQTLHEIISTGDIAMLQHLNAPTADGNILRLELLREKNAEIARVLPGKAWYILVGTGEQRSLRLLGRNGMEMEIRGTFRTRAAANERAERILQDSKEAAGPDARAVRADKDGLVGGGVAYREGGVVMAQTVEVRHETGRSSQVDSSGNRL